MTTQRHAGLGLLFMLLSSASFGTAGPFAKSLMAAGWTPGLVVLLRMTGAALILAVPALWLVRGRWGAVRRDLPAAALYGFLGVACAQFGYFAAVQRLPVGVALLLEYLAILLVVFWVWATTRRAPGRTTGTGIVTAIVGLVLVLDVVGQSAPDLVGVAWGLFAAVGMAGHYILAVRPTSLPALTFAAIGLGVGALLIAVAGLVGLVPLGAGATTVVVASVPVPAWLSLVELAAVAAAMAYVFGVLGARHLGSTVASFVGLTEVLFAIGFAALVLGEVPGPVQAIGGAVMLTGVVLVRLGDRRVMSDAAGAAPAVVSPARPSAPGPVG